MSTTIIIFIALALSSILCLFTNSWFIVWVLLEINTLSFCAIEFNNSETSLPTINESLINYLIVQSIASAILIIASMINESGNSSSTILTSIVVLTLIINIAAAPLHSWFIQVSNNGSWNNNNILFTWQNLIPTYLVIFQPNTIIFPFILFSAIVGSVFLVNNNSLKEILALSSVFNLSWMLAAISLSVNTLIIFSVVYWASLLTFINELTNNNSSSLNLNNSKYNNILLFLNTINLAGVPPLILFTVNWITFFNLLNANLFIITSLILIISSINIFVYLRLSSTILLQNTALEQNNNSDFSKSGSTIFLFINFATLQMLL